MMVANTDTAPRITESGLLLLGLAVRIVLLIWGVIQDETMLVKFTDIDYYVFSDAARNLSEGKSPYDRTTFRYSPLLAVLLSCNVYIHPYFGKLFFSILDIVAARQITRLAAINGVSKRLSSFCVAIWLFNPIIATISTRGNGDVITSVLVFEGLVRVHKGDVPISKGGWIADTDGVTSKVYGWSVVSNFRSGNQLPLCVWT
eukprot:jgi/Botrbrau1/21636/Bobra.43_1s0038.1